MGNPLVTVVIPAYNHENYVQQSIRSVIAQTYPNIELLVFNDGSTDGTHQKIAELVDECRRRFVRFEYVHQSNRGLASTLNTALKSTKGEFFSAHASDDAILPRKIELLLAGIESCGPRCAAAFGDARFIGMDGQPLTPADLIGPEASLASGEITFLQYYAVRRGIDPESKEFGSYRSLLAGNYLPAMSCLVRTSMAREAGGWTEGCPIEDWDLWLKLARSYAFCLVKEPVALYRIHGLNLHKTQPFRLEYWSLRLLMREKPICREKQYLQTWRREYLWRLFDHVLKSKEFNISQKMAVIDLAETMPIAGMFMHRLTRKVRQNTRKILHL